MGLSIASKKKRKRQIQLSWENATEQKGKVLENDVPDGQSLRLVSVDAVVMIEAADFLEDLAGRHVLEQDEAFLEHAEGAQALDSSESPKDG